MFLPACPPCPCRFPPFHDRLTILPLYRRIALSIRQASVVFLAATAQLAQPPLYRFLQLRSPKLPPLHPGPILHRSRRRPLPNCPYLQLLRLSLQLSRP